MALTLNGSANTIAGLAVGGLPDGIVDTDMLAANAVVTGKITDGTIAAADIASGVTGKILQVVTGTTTSGTTTTSTSWVDTGLTATITPTSSSNKILVFGAGQIGHYRDYSGQGMGIRMVRTVSSSDTEVYSGNGDEIMSFDNGQMVATRDRGPWSTMISDSPSTTSACAYKVQVLIYTSNNGGTAYFNSHDAGTAYMHLLEVAA